MRERSNVIEIPMKVVYDDFDEDTYVASPDAKGTVDLSKVTFRVLHPEEGSDEALLIIERNRRKRKPVECTDDQFLEELRRAEEHFSSKVPDGYLGYGYFLHHWKSDRLPRGMKRREPILERLSDDGKIVIYEAGDGSKAIRTA